MHLRLSRTQRAGKVYEYAQLVESVRRSDGVPTHRIIGTLGALSPLEVENLRAALGASRERKRVVIAPYAGRRTAAPDVLANLRYLDVAVALVVWREWGLSTLVAELMPQGDAVVPAASVVAALVLQRLVDPGSKLAATEWFPRTALPELLDLPPANFNNTRLHRVLEALDGATPSLMARLPARYQERDGAFGALFLDVSDATFVGQGPSFAQKAKTKEGMVARKIGIVLLCNPRGYPLRWEVVPGAAHDSKTMLGLLESVAGLRWLGNAPIVCDRAMGKTATLKSLLRLKLRFLTALTKSEFPSYGGDRLPSDGLVGLCPSSADDGRAESEAARIVTEAGMEPVDENLFVQEFGVVELPLHEDPTLSSAVASPARAMRLCRQMQELMDSGECPSLELARRRLGLARGVAKKYGSLRRLVEEIQQAVLAGEVCSLADLLRLAPLPRAEQLEHFRQLTTSVARRRRPAHAVPAPSPSLELAPETPPAPAKLRVVAYFNQERFVDKRYRAQVMLREIRQFIEELNQRLLVSSSRRTPASVEAEVDRKLRSFQLVECFTVRIHKDEILGRSHFRAEATLDETEWARRRRYDGFTLLVAHADVQLSAAELARLYRAKDTVEKDFHIIKSVVEVRPVHHRSDAKVRAHVTLCMLALLLERTLRTRLRHRCSAEAALEALEPCRLNQFADTSQAYGLTRATVEQKDILRHLDLLSLVDDEQVAERIHPR